MTASDLAEPLQLDPGILAEREAAIDVDVAARRNDVLRPARRLDPRHRERAPAEHRMVGVLEAVQLRDCPRGAEDRRALGIGVGAVLLRPGERERVLGAAPVAEVDAKIGRLADDDVIRPQTLPLDEMAPGAALRPLLHVAEDDEPQPLQAAGLGERRERVQHPRCRALLVAGAERVQDAVFLAAFPGIEAPDRRVGSDGVHVGVVEQGQGPVTCLDDEVAHPVAPRSGEPQPARLRLDQLADLADPRPVRAHPDEPPQEVVDGLPARADERRRSLRRVTQ